MSTEIDCNPAGRERVSLLRMRLLDGPQLGGDPGKKLRDRQESYQFEKLPGDNSPDHEPDLWTCLRELEDLLLFLASTFGLITLNSVVAVYFYAHSTFDQ